MKIFSKFKDYYDTALGWGYDPNVIYERTEKDITKEHYNAVYNAIKIMKERNGAIYNQYYTTFAHTFEGIETYHIIFCGKYYFGLKVEYVKKKKYITNEKASEFFYDFISFKKFIKKYSDINMEISDRYDKPYFKKRGYDYTTLEDRYKDIFSNQGDDSRQFMDLHFELDSPIILAKSEKYRYKRSSDKILLNPCLYDIGFVKMIDPFQAFQELSMFVSGVMGGKIPRMVEISNDDKIAKHGFDKYSFRKDKEK